MEQQLAVREAQALVRRPGFDDATVDLIRKTISDPRNPLTSDEFALFLEVCRHTGLNPLNREIYALRIDGRLTVWTGIDGHRRIAQASPRFRGMAGPYYCGPDGKWVDVWIDDRTPPVACRVGVYLPGRQEPTWGIAYYKNYRGRKSATWQNQPEHMLAVRAESFALRKCFSRELAGVTLADDDAGDRPDYIDADGVIHDEQRPARLDAGQPSARAQAIVADIDAAIAEGDFTLEQELRDAEADAAIEETAQRPPAPVSEATRLACAAFVDEVKAANPRVRVALPADAEGDVAWRRWLLENQKKWAESAHNPTKGKGS
jgi:phage recombination protein Bet